MKKVFFACLIFLAIGSAGCGTLGGTEGISSGTSGTGTGTTTNGGSVSGSGS